MTPTRWIVLLLALCVALMPVYPLIANMSVKGQDAAGRGMFSAFMIIALFILGGLAFGIPSVVIAIRHKSEVPGWARLVAWLVLFSPLIAGVVAFALEQIMRAFRHRS